MALFTPAHEEEEVFELLGLLGFLVVADDAGDDLGRSGLELAAVNGAGGAVDAHEVAFFEGLAGSGDGLLIVIDFESGSTTDADFTHLAGDESGVGGNPTLGGEDAFGSDHAAEVFRGGFVADEEDFFTLGFGDDGTVGVEVDLAGSGTRTGGEAGGDALGFLDVSGVEDRGEELVELIGRVAQNGGFPVDEFFLHHVRGELEGRRRRCACRYGSGA